jgi:hypothetical protein
VDHRPHESARADAGFDGALIERIGAGVDAARGQVPRADVRAWRDRMVTEIRRLKAENPLPTRQEQPL